MTKLDWLYFFLSCNRRNSVLPGLMVRDSYRHGVWRRYSFKGSLLLKVKIQISASPTDYYLDSAWTHTAKARVNMFLNNWHIPNYSLSMTSHHTIQLETDFLYLKTTGLVQDFLKGQLFKNHFLLNLYMHSLWHLVSNSLIISVVLPYICFRLYECLLKYDDQILGNYCDFPNIRCLEKVVQKVAWL